MKRLAISLLFVFALSYLSAFGQCRPEIFEALVAQPAIVFRNAQLSATERVAAAERLLGVTLSPAQKRALLAAHDTPGSVYLVSPGQIRQRVQALEPHFDRLQRRKLIEFGLAGDIPTRASLLASIAAMPEDGLRRLVYADWLDEHFPGSEESERIRIEVALEEKGDDALTGTLRSQRIARLHELRAKVNTELGFPVRWEHGFVTELTINRPIADQAAADEVANRLVAAMARPEAGHAVISLDSLQRHERLMLALSLVPEAVSQPDDRLMDLIRTAMGPEMVDHHRVLEMDPWERMQHLLLAEAFAAALPKATKLVDRTVLSNLVEYMSAIYRTNELRLDDRTVKADTVERALESAVEAHKIRFGSPWLKWLENPDATSRAGSWNSDQFSPAKREPVLLALEEQLKRRAEKVGPAAYSDFFNTIAVRRWEKHPSVEQRQILDCLNEVAKRSVNHIAAAFPEIKWESRFEILGYMQSVDKKFATDWTASLVSALSTATREGDAELTQVLVHRVDLLDRLELPPPLRKALLDYVVANPSQTKHLATHGLLWALAERRAVTETMALDAMDGEYPEKADSKLDAMNAGIFKALKNTTDPDAVRRVADHRSYLHFNQATSDLVAHWAESSTTPAVQHLALETLLDSSATKRTDAAVLRGIVRRLKEKPARWDKLPKPLQERLEKAV